MRRGYQLMLAGLHAKGSIARPGGCMIRAEVVAGPKAALNRTAWCELGAAETRSLALQLAIASSDHELAAAIRSVAEREAVAS